MNRQNPIEPAARSVTCPSARPSPGSANRRSSLDTGGPSFVNRDFWRVRVGASRTRCTKTRAHSSAGERSLHTGEVQGSIPCAPTIKTPCLLGFSHSRNFLSPQHHAERSRIRNADSCKIRVKCWPIVRSTSVEDIRLRRALSDRRDGAEILRHVCSLPNSQTKTNRAT
jgi:hypothetical protein